MLPCHLNLLHLRPHAMTTMMLPLRTTNPLLLNANTAVMAKLTNFLPLLLPLAIPITRRPHFIPRPTRFLPSLLLLTLFQHPNDHARSCRRPVHCKLLPPMPCRCLPSGIQCQEGRGNIGYEITMVEHRGPTPCGVDLGSSCQIKLTNSFPIPDKHFRD